MPVNTTELRLLPMSESTAHLCFDKEQFLKVSNFLICFCFFVSVFVLFFLYFGLIFLLLFGVLMYFGVL